jgi:Acyclic terpene utilisation family protein AtuA
MTMDEVRILAPCGMMGTGFPAASLQTAMTWQPHFMAIDAGTTDSGPMALGSGHCHYSRGSYRRDIKQILAAARAAKIPLIIGSAGGGGSRANVAWTRDILLEVARELDLKFSLGVIHADQDKDYLKAKLAAGRIKELGGVAPLNVATIARSTNIVGMMGVEPIQRALDDGAEVVLAGRSSDTAIFAAWPLMRGFAPGPVWHAAKILECGAACVEYRPSPDSMFAWVSKEGFTVRPPNAALTCTTLSVAAHALYENGDPYKVIEPGGTLDITEARYAQLADGAVRVTGSRFDHAKVYTVKLEGAEMVGFQTVAVGGMADPTILADVEGFLEATRKRTGDRIQQTYADLKAEDWRIDYRVYGLGRTVQKGGAPTRAALGGDVGVIIEVTAKTQEIANGLCSIARHQLLHQPVPRWKGFVSNYALAYGANDLVRGAVYRFNMNCVVEPNDPMEMFRVHLEKV